MQEPFVHLFALVYFAGMPPLYTGWQLPFRELHLIRKDNAARCVACQTAYSFLTINMASEDSIAVAQIKLSYITW